MAARLRGGDGCGDDGGMKRRAFVMGAAAMAAERMDLFLLQGRSNMAGRGVVELQDRVVIPGVFTLNFALNKEREWVPDVDPIHFHQPVAGVWMGGPSARTLLSFDSAGLREFGRRYALAHAQLGGERMQ